MDIKWGKDGKKCTQNNNAVYDLQSAMCTRWVQRNMKWGKDSQECTLYEQVVCHLPTAMC